MDAMECIKTRRSVRQFKNKKIPPDLINGILEAGMAAPSAGNEQAWEFVVIDDTSILKRIPEIHPYAAMTANAPVAILVCGNLDNQKYDGFWPQDCSAAVQNILLAAHALGLGTVWTGIHPIPERVTNFRKLLNIPDSIVPFALIPIGYPIDIPRPANRYSPEKVHTNFWTD
jgi:nitroreductase